MSEPTLQDCINYMRSQIKQMEKYPRNYEFNLPYYRKTVELLEKAQRPHGEWIPLKYRPMDEDEYRAFYKEYGDLPVEERKVFDCQMPADGQEILISTEYGHIYLDTCECDDCYGLEEGGDWDGVLAWMPLPEPYKKGGDPD